MPTPANLLPDAFAGAAAAYARYRPPYPRALLDDLLARAGPAPHGRLLDLACGPGRLALDLAADFELVWAVDLEPEMIAVGQKEAERRGVGNIIWLAGKAEHLAAPPGAFDLITIGEAFHRLDQTLIAHRAMDWLKSGGSLAIPGHAGILGGVAAWQIAVTRVAHRWMARAFPDGWGLSSTGAEWGPRAEARVLRSAGFTEVADHPFEESRDWRFAEIIGWLQSTSVCSKKALGDDFPAFEAEVRAALFDPAPSRTFSETSSWAYTFARKPR